MLSINRIRDNPDELKRMLASRYLAADDVDSLCKQDALRQRLMADSQEKKARRNQLSKAVGRAKQDGTTGEAVAVLLHQMRTLGSEIAAIDVDIAELDDKINVFLAGKPNYPHASVPFGQGEAANEEAYRWDTPRKRNRETKPY